MAGTAFICPGKVSLQQAVQKAGRGIPLRQARLNVTALVDVRPYTVRKGDTLKSIASKREFKIDDLKNLNHDADLDKLQEGQTILIPAGKLSARDKEILDGLSSGSYRLYPVRKGEKLTDIMSKRGIVRSEMQELNPGVNLDRLKEHQMLRLPSNKFTTREKEMLAGVGVPMEFFNTGKAYGIGFIAGMVVAGVVAYWTRKSEAAGEQ